MSNGRALIGDFGMALFVNREVGGVLGSWQWLAPEAIDSTVGTGYDERSDIFSLGMIFFELVALQVPYDEYLSNSSYCIAETKEWKLQAIKQAIISQELRPTIPESCPEHLAEIIRRCWLTDSSQRPSAQEIVQILQSQQGVSPSPLRKQLDIENIISPVTQVRIRSDKRSVLTRAKAVHLLTKPSVPIKTTPILGVTCMNSCFMQIWVGLLEGSIQIYNFDEQTQMIVQLTEFKAHIGAVRMLLCTGSTVWSCGVDAFVRVWEPSEGYQYDKTCEWNPFSESKLVYPSCAGLVYSSKGESVWLGSGAEGRITVWNQTTYRCEGTITSEFLLECNLIESFKNQVWVACRNSTIVMFDAATREFLGTFQPHTTRISQMANISGTFWSSSMDEIKIWEMNNPDQLDIRCVCTTKPHSTKVLSFLGRGEFVISLGIDGSVLLWNRKVSFFFSLLSYFIVLLNFCSFQEMRVLRELSDIKKPKGQLCFAHSRMWTCTNTELQVWPSSILTAQ